MKLSLILAFLWVLASAVTAMLPMRRQYIPGVSLLIAAPILIGFVGYQYGIWIALLGFAAFISMFRNPLRYLWKRARGIPVELPPEFREKKGS